MDYLILIFSGVAMGLIAAVPIGPVNLICIRRTFAFGPVNGFVSGLGAALGDGVFAVVTGYGLTWIAQLIEGYASIIELIGGVMLAYFGIHAFRAHPTFARFDEACAGKEQAASTLARAMASTFALTVTNPATLLAFTAMFAGLGGLAGGDVGFVNAGFVVAGVFAGSTGWWLMLTTVIGFFHARIDDSIIAAINRVSGGLITLFGVAVLIRLFLKIA